MSEDFLDHLKITVVRLLYETKEPHNVNNLNLADLRTHLQLELNQASLEIIFKTIDEQIG